jgi:nucleotide-binding universal stress UspA family protein
VPYEKEILIGNIAEVIARRADELGCDGIVMGTRGMTAIGGLVMGSVATKVVHAANVPVTLVK